MKLLKVVAEAIEVMRAKGTPNNEIVERHIHGDHIQVNGYVSVDLLSTDTLIRALYIGYEVEETPEDTVRELYKNVGNYDGVDIQKVVRDVLDLLNIKIEGVNA